MAFLPFQQGVTFFDVVLLLSNFTLICLQGHFQLKTLRGLSPVPTWFQLLYFPTTVPSCHYV